VGDGTGDVDEAEDVDLGEAPPIPPVEEDETEATASEAEWLYLTDSDRTEQVLSSAPIRWGASRVQVRTLERMGEGARSFSFKMVLAPDEGEEIRAQYKVRQTAYYFEWKREIHGYRLGRMLGLPVVPAVERKLPRKRFDVFSGKLTEEDLEIIRWEPWGAVRGSMRYWVEALHPRRIGGRVADEAYLMEIATALHPANGEALADPAYGVYLDMGRAFVFDYLILNDDRARNLGTVIAPGGARHLVLIDQGLGFGLQTAGRKEAKGYLDAMTLFPRDTIEKLRALDEAEILDMLVPPSDNVIAIKPKAAAQLWTRRGEILDRVDGLHDRYGDLIWY
jgi:hypothetical protein